MKKEKIQDSSCLVCNKTFPFRRNKKFCSTTCRVQAFERRGLAFEFFDLIDSHVKRLLPKSNDNERLEWILEDVKNVRSNLDYSFCLEWYKKKSDKAKRERYSKLSSKIRSLKQKVK